MSSRHQDFFCVFVSGPPPDVYGKIFTYMVIQERQLEYTRGLMNILKEASVMHRALDIWKYLEISSDIWGGKSKVFDHKPTNSSPAKVITHLLIVSLSHR